MRLAGITFDLDGTLADTLPVCYVAFRRVFQEHVGREFTDEEIHALFGPCEKGTIQKVVANWQPALEMFLREYEAAHDACEAPFTGIVEVLDWLKQQGIRMAVVTGKGANSAAISLRRLGLLDRFEVVEAGAPEGPVKPQAIQRVLDLWQLSPEVVVHIGDAPSDITAARSRGVGALGAAWASTARADLLEEVKPDAIFTEVGQFRDWLASMAT